VRIAVTGANGLVGSRVCGLLAAGGHEVTGISRGPKRTSGAFRYASCDLTNEAQTRAVLGGRTPELIIHCASMTDVDACQREPQKAYAENVLATGHVAASAREAGAHLVHVSTDYVFDGENGPYTEDSLPNPRGAYALTKHAAEEVVRTLCPSWAIARTAVVFGWPPAAKLNFGAWLVTALAEKKPTKLFQDQRVSPTLAGNLAAMLAEIGLKRAAGVWNLCGKDQVSRVEFGLILCEVFDFDKTLLTAVNMADVALPSPRPLRSGLLTDKAERELDEKPLPLRQALELLRRDYEASPKP
jgi:dTDP-4-dehydrorhamnose reductase